MLDGFITALAAHSEDMIAVAVSEDEWRIFQTHKKKALHVLMILISEANILLSKGVNAGLIAEIVERTVETIRA